MKKAAIFILSLLLCISSGTMVCATEPETLLTVAQDGEGLDLTAKSAVVMEAGSGTILYQKDKDMKLPPASVTKVMSLLLIFEELDKGNLKYSDKVTVSEHAASMGGSQVFLEPGESQTVDTMLKCIVISSANDAVVSMAEHIAGSEGAFVKRMNEKAKQLGMKNTTFKNSCGLDIKGHETSAYDIALMSRELTTKHPDIFKYTKIWMDKFTHETKKGTKEFGLSNTNKLLKQYNGCTGLKTGSTSTAKFCLSATAHEKRGQSDCCCHGQRRFQDKGERCQCFAGLWIFSLPGHGGPHESKGYRKDCGDKRKERDRLLSRGYSCEDCPGEGQ